jgi:hypothetical protein
MFSTFRKVVLSAALAGAVFAPVAAHADPLPVSDTVTVFGTGQLTHGFQCAPCGITLNFTAIFAGDDGAGTTNCTFTGTDPAGTLVAGSGSGTVACDDGSSASVTFTRIGPVVTLSGTVSHGGTTHTIAAGALVFVPEDANGLNFVVAGQVVLVD